MTRPLLVLLALACGVVGWSTLGCAKYESVSETKTDHITRIANVASTAIFLVRLEGHDYLLAQMVAGYAGGSALVHAESCPCKEKP